MSRSTGPILAAGIITIVNDSVLNKQPMDFRVAIATGLLAGGASLVEKALPDMTVVLSWTLLLTILLTRVKPNIPSPTESVLDWWNGINPSAGT